MDQIDARVKPRRRYDSHRRQQQALRTRTAVLDVAQDLFLTRGYAATTIGLLAETADVSAETIYKNFGGKPGLVRAIWERGLEGSGPVPAERRSDEMRANEIDARKVITNWGTLTTEVAPRVAPILLLIRTAATTDPEMGTLHAEVDRARLTRMEYNARQLYDRGDLRAGVTVNDARDVLWTYSSPELYELLVLRLTWPLERYGRFIAESMIAALLPPSAGVGV